MIGLVAASAAARLALIVAVAPWSRPLSEQLTLNRDSTLYHELAVALLERGEFRAAAEGFPEALRTPGYPAFLTFVYGVFGPLPWAAMLCQVALAALTAAVLFLALARVVDQRAAFFGALLFTLDPIVVLHDSILMSESLFTMCIALLLAAGVFALTGAQPRPPLGWALVGLCAGASAWVRPVSLYLPLCLVPVIVAVERAHPWRAGTRALTLIATFLIVVAPWFFRNQRELGAFSFSASGPHNLLVMNVGMMEARREQQPLRIVQHDLRREVAQAMTEAGADPNDNDLQRARYELRVAREHILVHLPAFLFQHLQGSAFMFANLATYDFARILGHPATEGDRTQGVVRSFLDTKDRAEWCVAGVVAPLLLLISTCVGLGVWRSRDTVAPEVTLFLLAVAAYFVLIPGAFAIGRFRIPAMPFLCGFGGIGAERLWTRWSHSRQR